MASIGKRNRKGGPVYRVSWRLPDGTQRSKSFKTHDEAKAHKVSVEALEQSGRTPDPQKGAQTLRDWSEAFMGTLHLKPQTEAHYRSLLRSRILPAFGDSRLDSITRLQVQQWVSQMAGEVSAKRTTAAYRLLRQMLSEAVKHDYLIRNPADDIRLPRVERRDLEPLSIDQLKAVARHCGRYESLVLWLGIMGTRWSETIALTPAQFRDGMVTIDRSLSEVSGKFHATSTKTWEVRRLPVPSELLKSLDFSTPFIFTTTYGNPVRSGHFRDNVFNPALDKAGVGRIRIHDLRHCAASNLINQGANIKVVQEWLGHSSVQITLDTYTHLFKTDLEEISSKLNTLI